jgi:hypothetical protein
MTVGLGFCELQDRVLPSATNGVLKHVRTALNDRPEDFPDHKAVRAVPPTNTIPYNPIRAVLRREPWEKARLALCVTVSPVSGNIHMTDCL